MNFIELDGHLINLDKVVHISYDDDGYAILSVDDRSYINTGVKYEAVKEVIGEMQPYGLFRRGRRDGKDKI